MSIINKIGWPILVEASVRLLKYVVDKIYDYKEKKLQKEIDLKKEDFDEHTEEETETK